MNRSCNCGNGCGNNCGCVEQVMPLTPELVKEFYEKNVNTNVFTDAEKNKLAKGGIGNGGTGTGTQGPKGDRGDKGDNGTDGINGTNGIDGRDGISWHLAGRDTEANVLLKPGAAGDMWIITEPGHALDGHAFGWDILPGGSVGWRDMGQFKGDKGDQGNDGVRGHKGDTGPKGTKGTDGTVGAKGDQGAAGATGGTGPQGPTGAKGATGSAGGIGHKGADGKDGTGVSIKGSAPKADILTKTGAAGDMWLITSTGTDHGHGMVSNGKGAGAANWTDVGAIQGPKGEIGHTGATGTAGSAGALGPVGAKGATGPRGHNGATGIPGSKGKDGTTWHLVGRDTEAAIVAKPGNEGDIWLVTEPGKPHDGHAMAWEGTAWVDKGQMVGDKGAIGHPGHKGLKGDTGKAGPKGADGKDSVVPGPRGTKGDKGDRGDTGHAGPVGPKGDTGPRGVDGSGANITGFSGKLKDADGKTVTIDRGLVKNAVTPPVAAVADAEFDWFSLTPDNKGWGMDSAGNTVKTDYTQIVSKGFPGTNTTVDGKVSASDHIHLAAGQKIFIPRTNKHVESITYYDPVAHTFKTMDYTDGGSENHVLNADFGTGDLTDWDVHDDSASNPAHPGDHWTWKYIDDTTGAGPGIELDFKVVDPAHAPQTFNRFTKDIPVGSTCVLSYDTEILREDVIQPPTVDVNGHLTSEGPNLFVVAINAHDKSFYTRGGTHEYSFTATTDVTKIKLSRSGPAFKGVWRNLSLRTTLPFGLTKSCSNIFKLPKRLKTSDIPYLNKHPNVIQELIDGIKHPALSFNRQDLLDGGGYYPCSEGHKGDQHIHNVLPGASLEIDGFTADCRLLLTNTRDGLNNLRVVKHHALSAGNTGPSSDLPRGYPWVSVLIDCDVLSSHTKANPGMNDDIVERIFAINANCVDIHMVFKTLQHAYHKDLKAAVEYAFSESDKIIKKVRAYNSAHGTDHVVRIKVEDFPQSKADQECKDRSLPIYWSNNSPCKDTIRAFAKKTVQHFSRHPEVVYYKFMAEPRMYLPGDTKRRHPKLPTGWNVLLEDLIAIVHKVDPEAYVGVALTVGGNISHISTKYTPFKDDRVIYDFSSWAPNAYTMQGVGRNIYPVKYPGQIGGEMWNKAHIKRQFTKALEFQKKYSVLLGVGIGVTMCATTRDKFISDLVEVYRGFGWSYGNFNGGYAKSSPYTGFGIFYDAVFQGQSGHGAIKTTYKGLNSETAKTMKRLNAWSLTRPKTTRAATARAATSNKATSITVKLARFNGTGEVIELGRGVNGTKDFTMFIAFTKPENIGAAFKGLVSSGVKGTDKLSISYKTSLGNNTVKLTVGTHTEDITLSAGLPIHGIGVVWDSKAKKIQVVYDNHRFYAPKTAVFAGTTGNVMIGTGSTVDKSYQGYLVGDVVFSEEKATQADWNKFWNAVSRTHIPQ